MAAAPAANMDQFLVVVEPGARSVRPMKTSSVFAADLGVKRVRVVANKVRDEDRDTGVCPQRVIPAEGFLGCIHYNPEIMDADRNGKSRTISAARLWKRIRNIKGHPGSG